MALLEYLDDGGVTVDRIGVGASGAIAYTKVDDTITATVHHTGTMTATEEAPLSVNATNTSVVLANTGGSSVMLAVRKKPQPDSQVQSHSSTRRPRLRPVSAEQQYMVFHSMLPPAMPARSAPWQQAGLVDQSGVRDQQR